MKHAACSLTRSLPTKLRRPQSGGPARQRRLNPTKADNRSVATILHGMNAEVAMRNSQLKTECLEKLVLLALLLVWLIFALM